MPGSGPAKDAAIIAAAQRVEHYEIAAYGTARTLADELGFDQAKGLLDETLDEESAADKLLTKIATGGLLRSGLNADATQGLGTSVNTPADGPRTGCRTHAGPGAARDPAGSRARREKNGPGHVGGSTGRRWSYRAARPSSVRSDNERDRDRDRRLVAMGDVVRLMPRRKRIALIAHDNCKADMLAWARFNAETLAAHELHATGTTGALLTNELGLRVERFLSGPLGGDQQVGAAIAEGRIDFLVFFWDPLEPQPHDVDVKALLEDRGRLQRADGLQPGHR